jgi:calcium-dependent protein kinase
MMYIILSGIPPFNGGSDSEIMNAIRAGKFHFKHAVWNQVGDDAKDLITKMLTFD